MDNSDLGRTALEIALKIHKHHKEHRTVEVEVEQQHDAIGTALAVRFQVPMPPGAIAVAQLTSAWGFTVGSHDEHLFRAESGDFVTHGPILDQVAVLYIPYGVLRHRKAGVYTMGIAVVLLPSTSASAANGVELAVASTKIVLPSPQPWHKIDYLWPFIALCMAVVRADDAVTADEVRPLKALLVDAFRLGPADMDGLRLAMKTPPPDDLPALVDAVCLRMPHFSPEDLLTTLLGIARADAPINPREHSVLRMIAAHVGLDERAWTRLLDRHEL